MALGPRVASLLLATFLAGTASAQSRPDPAAEIATLTARAEAGEAGAQLQLATRYDFGRGVARDSARALRWYLAAAESGLADAQLNTAVMLDSGAGGPRDVTAAATWYARAAAQGNARAQYNLGLLYRAGDGVPRNLDLARYWFDAASSRLPAAENQLSQLGTETPAPFAAPMPQSGDVVATANGDQAQLVWTAPPAADGVEMVVQLMQPPDAGGLAAETIIDGAVAGSALAVAVPTGPLLWRVLKVDRPNGRYAASDWQVSGGEAAPAPIARITLSHAADDAPAAELAQELLQPLREAGFWVSIDADGQDAPATAVRYGFSQDAAIARRVAEGLPALTGDRSRRDPAIGPGAIVVDLVGGPVTASARPQSSQAAASARRP